MSQLYDIIYSEEDDDNSIERLLSGFEFQPVRFPLCFSRLDKSSSFLREGTLAVLAGDPSCGKSLFTKSLLIHCYRSGIKCCYLPLESDKNFYLRRIACKLNKSWDALSDNSEVAKTAISAVRSELEELSKIIHENPGLPDQNGFCRDITPEFIISWAEGKFKAGVKIVFVDPMAQIDFQKCGINQYQSENAFVQKIVTLAQRYNACFVLVVHTVKSYDNLIPRISNLQGGAALSRLASSILMLHNHDAESKRKLGSNIFTSNGFTKKEEFDRIIHVAKARNASGTGVKIAFQFFVGCFREVGFFAPKSQLNPEPVSDNFQPYKD